MAKLTSIESDTTQRVVVYGGPKSGKTELVGRLSEYYNLLWFDLENGHNTLTKFPTAWKDRINLINIRDSRVYPIAIETMMKVIKGTAVDICEEHSKVSCALCKKDSKAFEHINLSTLGPRDILVIDSLTQLTNSAMAHITKLQPDEYKLQLDDWGNLRVLIDKFLSQIQAARYNVVCITHEEEVTLEDGRKKIVPVSGSSNSSRNTAKYFDHVVYCDVKNKKHVAGSGTDYSMGILAGSRTDVRLELTDKPATLLDIFTSWRYWDTLESSNPNFDPRLVIPPNSLINLVVDQSTLSTKGTELPKSPGQIALDNLKKQQLIK